MNIEYVILEAIYISKYQINNILFLIIYNYLVQLRLRLFRVSQIGYRKAPVVTVDF